MAIALRQSTASQEVPLGPFVDSTDGATAKTALTIANTDIKIWVNGATSLVNKNSGGGTHMSNGVYSAVLDATDTATLGPMVLYVQVATALPIKLECVVLNAMNYDSAIAGTDTLNVDVTQWNGTNVTTPDTAGSPKVTVTSGTSTGQISLTSGLVTLAAVTHTGAVIPTVTTTTTATTATNLTNAPTAGDLTATMKTSVTTAAVAALDTILADSVPADGTIPTLRQAVYMMNQFLTERSITTTTMTVRKVDGSTALMTFTLNSATAPTSITRTT
jgi:hypothetical protein